MGDMPYEVDKPGEPYITKKNKNKATAVPDNSPRVYTQEEVDSILERRQQREERKSNDDEGEGVVVGIDPKLLKQLQSTVSVFNTLKEFASSPLQKAIETEVGSMAVGAIKQSFGRPAPQGNKDLFDMILNSQLAFGFGQGLGARGPEFVESMGRTLGKEKTDKFIDGMLEQYGKKGGSGGGGSTGGSWSRSPGTTSPSEAAKAAADSSPDSGANTERDSLLRLDPNNSEHVAAYAESQGNIRVEVARKMLMIHQDEFIEQMRLQGLDVSGFGQKKNTKSREEEEEIMRLKQEQQEMLILKQKIDQQLQQQENQEKVVSYKDIQKQGKINKVPTIDHSNIIGYSATINSNKLSADSQMLSEDIVQIPDQWDQNDLSEAELESIRKAEIIAKQSNINHSHAPSKNIEKRVEGDKIEGEKEERIQEDTGSMEKESINTEIVVVEPDKETILPISTVPEEIITPPISDTKKYKFKVTYGKLKKILLDKNGKETGVRTDATDEEIIVYEKEHGVKIQRGGI